MPGCPGTARDYTFHGGVSSLRGWNFVESRMGVRVPSRSSTEVFLANRRAGLGGRCRASRVCMGVYPKMMQNRSGTTTSVHLLPVGH